MAPADQTLLRRVIEAHKGCASPDMLAMAQERLQVLVTADSALETAMGSIKELRLAIPQNASLASPGVVTGAKEKLLTMEQEADMTLLTELGAVVEVAAVRELLERYADQATEDALGDVQARLESLKTADATLASAVARGFGRGSIAPLRQSIEDCAELASVSVATEARTTLESWVATDAANKALQDAPADQGALRQLIETHASQASVEVLEEAQSLLNVLATADGALRNARESGLIKALQQTIEEYSSDASPAELTESTEALSTMVLAKEKDLRAVTDVAVEAKMVREAADKYRENVSVELYETVIARADRIEAADEALERAIHTHTVEYDEPEKLETAIAVQRQVAGPSIVAKSEAALAAKVAALNAAANKALREAPGDFDALQEVINTHRRWADKEVLALASVILKALQTLVALKTAIDNIAADPRRGALRKVLRHYEFIEFYNVPMTSKHETEQQKIQMLNDTDAELTSDVADMQVLAKKNINPATGLPNRRHVAIEQVVRSADEASRACQLIFVELFKNKSNLPGAPKPKQPGLFRRKVVSGTVQSNVMTLLTSSKDDNAPTRLTGMNLWEGARPCQLPLADHLRQVVIFKAWAEALIELRPDGKAAAAVAAARSTSELTLESAPAEVEDEAETDAVDGVDGVDGMPARPTELTSQDGAAGMGRFQRYFHQPYGRYYRVSDTGVTEWETDEQIAEAEAAGIMPIMPQLPDGWQEFADPASGYSYYVEVASGRTTWIVPTARGVFLGTVFSAWREVGARIKAAREEAAANALPPGWEECFDHRTGRYFYVDPDGKQTWERPKATPKAELAAEAKSAAEQRKRALKEARERQLAKSKAKAEAKAAEKAKREAAKQKAVAMKREKQEAKEREEREAIEAAERAIREAAEAEERAIAEANAAEEAAVAARARARREAQAALRKPWEYKIELSPLENMKDWMAFKKSGARELFKKWDIDGNGSISKAEFVTALPKCGFDLPTEQADALFTQLDDDGSEEITFREMDRKLRETPKDLNAPVEPVAITPGYEALMKLLKANSKRVVESFKKWDLNKNGSLSKYEFRELIPRLVDMLVRDPNAFNKVLRDKDVDHAFSTIDKDGSNDLSFEELEAALTKKKSKAASPLPGRKTAMSEDQQSVDLQSRHASPPKSLSGLPATAHSTDPAPSPLTVAMPSPAAVGPSGSTQGAAEAPATESAAPESTTEANALAAALAEDPPSGDPVDLSRPGLE